MSENIRNELSAEEKEPSEKCSQGVLGICEGREIRGRVTLNKDADTVAAVREGLKRTGGYCPCRLERTPDYKCICKEFREQIANPDFEGYCHCMLYYKSKGPVK